LAAIAIAATVAVAGCGNGETKTVTMTTPAQATVTQQAADPNSALLVLGYKCDAALDSGAFVADLRVGNQGGTGLQIWSFARWDREGGEPVTSVKTFRLRPGRYRTVKYRVKALPGQIAAHQSAGSRCKVDSRVVGTFESAG
jgi:hypothetical protein